MMRNTLPPLASNDLLCGVVNVELFLCSPHFEELSANFFSSNLRNLTALL